jgi:hypothetical protein
VRPWRSRLSAAAVLTLIALAGTGATAQPAEAINPCAVVRVLSGVAGRGCDAITHPGRVISAGGKLLKGHLGGAINTFLGSGGSGAGLGARTAVGLAAVGAWVILGARSALHETATVLSASTTPRLGSTWFSSIYWRMAGIAAMLTLPFLFAAAVQGVIRSDLSLIVRSALGYLPLAMLAVTIAAPLTVMLLAATDELSALVSSAAGHASVHFLQSAGAVLGALSVGTNSLFLAFMVAIFTVMATLALWLELLVREAAVYIIVLMLPLAFAALVWPARRIWAQRAVEVLVALILSKFVIVAVLSLGAVALNAGSHLGVVAFLGGLVLVAMAVFSPWALMRLVPVAELASGAAAALRGGLRGGNDAHAKARGLAGVADDWVGATAYAMAGAAGGRDQPDAAVIAPGGASSTEGGSRSAPSPAGTGTETVASDEVADAGLAGAATGPGVANEEVGSAAASRGNGHRAVASDGALEAGGRVADEGVASEPDPQPPAVAAERLPGLGPIWQEKDFSWPAVILGLDQESQPRWANDETDAPAGPGTGSADAGARSRPPAARPEPRAAPDADDPRPAGQEPVDGRL